ncbi:MAG: hypothetical protein AAGC74_06555 [Verrucomicrobiota bacterium]
MRVPLFIAIPLLFIVPVLVWLLSTRGYDFMTPRELSEAELRPTFASPADPELVAALETKTAPTPPEPSAPPLPRIPLGDLEKAPAIDEYRMESAIGAQALLVLANELLDEKQPQRALLAFERIIDSTPPGGPERHEANLALPSLIAELPPWNDDSTKRTPITLNCSTSRPEEELLPAIRSLRAFLQHASSQLCDIEFTLIPAPEPEAPLSSFPIAVWLTIPGEDPDQPALPVKTFNPSPDAGIALPLAKTIYHLLSTRVRNIPDLTPLPPIPEETEINKLFLTTITRLTWQTLLTTPFQPVAETLPNPESPQPPTESEQPTPESDQ